MRPPPLLVLAALFVAAAPSVAHAQLRKLKVVSDEGQPVVYAYVTVEGGTGQISDENGEINLGAGKAQTVTVNARRIGYKPWFGKVDLPDTAAVVTVTLPRIAQSLTEVRVSGRASPGPALQAFYDRWLMRQKGLLSAVFIGPEELDFRHPNKITNMLSGLQGVTLKRSARGFQEVYGSTGSCKMAIVVDGIQQCPPIGCKVDYLKPCQRGAGRACDPDEDKILLDDFVDAGSVAAIEVYARGGNMPSNLSVNDSHCGVIAIWTGPRK